MEHLKGESVDRAEKLRILRKVSVVPNTIEDDPIFYGNDVNKFSSPNDSGESKNHWILLEEAHDVALPRLMRLQQLYPDKSYISIGFTSSPVQRDFKYNANEAFYRRDYFNPKLHIEKQILYKSCSKYNALFIEYFMQKHLQNGLWSSKFGDVANPQALRVPKVDNYPKSSYFVYAKFSHKKANFNIKHKIENKSDEED